MGVLDFLSKRDSSGGWDPKFKGVLKDVSYEEIVSVLGRPKKAQGQYIYWRGDSSDIDEDSEGMFQVSNKDWRGYGYPAKKPSKNVETWFIVSTSISAMKVIADELGSGLKNVEEV